MMLRPDPTISNLADWKPATRANLETAMMAGALVSFEFPGVDWNDDGERETKITKLYAEVMDEKPNRLSMLIRGLSTNWWVTKAECTLIETAP